MTTENVERTQAPTTDSAPAKSAGSLIDQLTRGLSELDSRRDSWQKSEDKLDGVRRSTDTRVAQAREKAGVAVAQAREKGNAEISAVRARVNSEIEKVRLAAEAEVEQLKAGTDAEVETAQRERDRALEQYANFRHNLVRERKLVTSESLDQSGHPVPHKRPVRKRRTTSE